MDMFIRDDGCSIRVVAGYRRMARAYRPSANPKPDWQEDDYRTAAALRRERWQRRRAEITSHAGPLDGARVLEIGCGAGIDCLLLGLEPVQSVIGLDLQPQLLAPGAAGRRLRHLAEIMLRERGLSGTLAECAARLPVRLLRGDATRLPFMDGTFDVLWTRTVLEHLVPPSEALAEMIRVVRPGGLIYHLIDPFYWHRGCHKRGVVDIPWAHARLTLDEYRRFVEASEGSAVAAKRCHRLETLNRFTLRQWRQFFESLPLQILEWREEERPYSTKLLQAHPDVLATRLEGVEVRDLNHGVLKVWLRKSDQ